MRNGFYAGLCALFLAGCASTAPLRVLPTELMQECPYPQVDVRTNQGISEGLVAYHQALKLCNIDKAGLRKWAQ